MRMLAHALRNMEYCPDDDATRELVVCSDISMLTDILSIRLRDCVICDRAWTSADCELKNMGSINRGVARSQATLVLNQPLPQP
jgi:hypothetical protein